MFFSPDSFIALANELNRSEEFIQECLNYASELQKKSLPIIFSTQHLKNILEIDDFYKILKDSDKLYKFYTIKKRNGRGFRQIVTPYRNLKVIQHFIHAQILNKVSVSEFAHGFIHGRSILTNAYRHTNADAILNIDLFRFFDSIPERRVYGIFKSLGYANNLAYDLARLCTVQLPEDYLNSYSAEDKAIYNKMVGVNQRVLPQGAPTSPTLSNLVLIRLDRRLGALATKHQLNYSRYADDLTFSGNKQNMPSLSLINHIIRSEGFSINWEKVGLYSRGRKQLVTGLTVSNGVHVKRTFKREVAKHLFACRKFGVEQHLSFLKKGHLDHYKEWLFGKICFIKSIEKEVGSNMMRDFNTIEWPIL